MRGLWIRGRRARVLLGAGLLVGLCSLGWLLGRGSQPPWQRAAGTAQEHTTGPGVGVASLPKKQRAGASSIAGLDPVAPALSAYNKGGYREAERAARRVVEQAKGSKEPAKRRQVAQARWVLAFSAARRKNLSLARERFALLRKEAAALPDKGRAEARPGQSEPTLLEEAGYQHAVCTQAGGAKKAAEAE